MISRRTLFPAMLLASAPFLGGCVVGQSLAASYEAGPAVAATGSAVAENVHDKRPYVTSGDKPPYFIGKYQGGFGNPWDVVTQDKQPLATLLQRGLSEELKSLGHTVFSPDEAARLLDVAVKGWNFDGMLDGRIWYELDARVLNCDDALPAQSTVKDAQFIERPFWTGAKSGFEAKMPELYASAIRKLVRDNPTISTALAAQ